MHKPLTTIPQTSTHFIQDKIRNKKTSEKNRAQLEEKKQFCTACTFSTVESMQKKNMVIVNLEFR